MLPVLAHAVIVLVVATSNCAHPGRGINVVYMFPFRVGSMDMSNGFAKCIRWSTSICCLHMLSDLMDYPKRVANNAPLLLQSVVVRKST